MTVTASSLSLIAALLLPLTGAADDAVVGVQPGKTIYRCRNGGVTTFADRPCGDTAEPYDGLDRLNIVAAPAVAKPRPDPTKAKDTARAAAAARKEAAAEAKTAAACARTREALRKIGDRMRTGYSVSQGERLKARRRELEAQRRALAC